VKPAGVAGHENWALDAQQSCKVLGRERGEEEDEEEEEDIMIVDIEEIV